MERQLIAAGRGPDEISEIMSFRFEGRDPAVAAQNRQQVVELAREKGVPLAAHDDATLDHVEEAHRDGCTISEFPVTLEAARRARDLGMMNAMGGPNFVRGEAIRAISAPAPALRQTFWTSSRLTMYPSPCFVPPSC